VVVQTNGSGLSLVALKYSSIAAIRSRTLWNTPRRIALSVSFPNHRSAIFNHELEVRVSADETADVWRSTCSRSRPYAPSSTEDVAGAIEAAA
jgi:hypothetical protein